MILVDTSVWVDHLREGSAPLSQALERAQVVMHPFVIGELACGNLRNRQQVLRLLKDLPRAPLATDEEVLTFIERHVLMGRGIGYIDVHLLASTALGDATKLWSIDKRLASIAGELGLAYEEGSKE